MKNLYYRSCILLACFCIACTGSQKIKKQSAAAQKSSFTASDLFFLSPEKQLAYFQNAEGMLSTNTISAGKRKYPIVEAYRDFSGFSFKYKDTVRTWDDFVKQTNAVGIIVIRNDSVLLEQYYQNTTPDTKWINFSVAKSVTSLLYGAALADGYIKSLEAKVSEFIPELKGGVYDSVSLHNLLQMSSGVKWLDDANNSKSDLFRIGRIEKEKGWKASLDSIRVLKRAYPPGRMFNYNTMETALAGIILRKAVGKPLSQYLSERIWKPFGMHANANWVKLTDLDVENGGCCISSTLRDYALLGLFAMKNGVALNGEQVLPKDWMKKSVTPTSSYKGYGYYWWLHPKIGTYFASGSFGQQVEIAPDQHTVIAIQSYWPVAFDDYYIDYIDGFIAAVLEDLKKRR